MGNVSESRASRLFQGRIGRFLAVTAAIIGAPSVTSAQATAGTGTIVGQVVAAVEGTPIGYAVVSIPALGREQFTAPDGRFTISNVPAGRVTVRAKNIGHLPRDVEVDVVAGARATVTVSLERIPTVLPPVAAAPPCTAPGVPSATEAPELTTLVDQLRQNAERYRLLVRDYPFRYVVERRHLKRWASDGKTRELRVDTVAYAPASDYVYAPGTVMRRTPAGQPWFMFAQLDDWAGTPFLDNHCFTFAGEVELEGKKLLRLDFNAWQGIKDPDIDGSIFLDPKTYQIRRTVVSLSKLPRELPPDAGGVISTTVFNEILPSIPVVGIRQSETRVRLNPLNQAWEANIEEHVLLQVQFFKGPP
jgi:hypothetical protein